MQLLQTSQLPLFQFPHLAQAHQAEAIHALHWQEEDGGHIVGNVHDVGLVAWGSRTDRAASWADPSAPSPQANLLSNYLMVPGPAAEAVLDGVVEQMVVFQPREDTIQARKTSKQFPQELSNIFLSRRFVQRWASRIRYDRREHKLYLPNVTEPLRTSDEYRISLTSTSAKAALIPVRAAIFAYIHYGKGFPTGGFLYCDEGGQPLAVNSISFSPTNAGNTLSCGSFQGFGWEAAVVLRARAQPVDVQFLLDGGATHYAWVGPGEKLPGGFTAGLVGGFAYFFGNAALNRYFPITSAGKMLGDLVQLRSCDERLPSLPVDMDFPQTLGAIYLRREVTIREDVLERPVFDSVKRTLTLFPGAVPLRTSPEYPVTLRATARRAALIPMQAQSFAYVHYGENFPTGGFLYLGHDPDLGNKKVYAINSISFSHRRYALSFGRHHNVPESVSQALKSSDRVQPISEDTLKEKGAKLYAWVGPGEKLPDEKRPDFVAGPGGGFVYLFDNPSDDRYFPTVGAAEVVDRAIVSGDLNCAMLPVDATGWEIEHTVTFTRTVSALHQAVRCLVETFLGHGAQKACGVPVRIARLKVPDVTHPVVLHALAFTPRAEALDTIAAKAIAQLGWIRAQRRVCVDICLELLSLAAICMVSQAVRGDDLENGAVSLETRRRLVASLVIIFTVWLKDFFSEVVLFMGYYRWSWSVDYFTSHKLIGWVHWAMMLYLMVWLFVGLTSTFAEKDHVRPVLAVVGCMKWVVLLVSLRGFQFLRLGARILPILAALGEVKDFILIIFFFLAAYGQASYVLSEPKTSVNQIMFSVYKLAFLSSFDVSTDIRFGEEGEDVLPWRGPQYVSFVFFSFVIAVALSNIFIGVLGSAFDDSQAKVGQLFVRARAAIALDFALHCQGEELLLRCLRGGKCCYRADNVSLALRQSDPAVQAVGAPLRLLRGAPTWASPYKETLWFCYPRCEKEEEGDSLRGSLKAVGDSLSRKLDGMDVRMRWLEDHLGGSDTGHGTDARQPPSPPGITSSLSPSQRARIQAPQRYLNITIVGATNLRDADVVVGHGSSDTYCTCQVLGKPETRAATKICRNTASPTWMCRVRIVDFVPTDSLQFAVWDQDWGKGDDALGHATLPIKQFLSVGEFSGEVPLEQAGNKTAQLELRISVVSTAREGPLVPGAVEDAV